MTAAIKRDNTALHYSPATLVETSELDSNKLSLP